MSLQRFHAEWLELDKEFNQLQETHKVYRHKLDELTNLQAICSNSISKQKRRLKDLACSLRRCKLSANAEEIEVMQRINDDIKERRNVFFDMEAFLPKKNGLYLNLVLGNVNVTLFSKQAKFAYKDEYEKFKLYLTIILLLGAISCMFLLNRVIDEIFNFLLVWYYCTLTIRESVLISNGSRNYCQDLVTLISFTGRQGEFLYVVSRSQQSAMWMLWMIFAPTPSFALICQALSKITFCLACNQPIVYTFFCLEHLKDFVEPYSVGWQIKGWWVSHHYVSTFLSGVMLTWPNGLMYQMFRSQFLAFSIYQSCVQFLQYYYQSGCLYRLRALGERDHMDLTVEGFQSWMWRGLTFLLPFLFFGHFWQLYNSLTLFGLSQHEGCKEWQVFVLALTFLVLFLGNFLTTLKVVHQKFQKNKDKLKKL